MVDVLVVVLVEVVVVSPNLHSRGRLVLVEVVGGLIFSVRGVILVTKGESLITVGCGGNGGNGQGADFGGFVGTVKPVLTLKVVDEVETFYQRARRTLRCRLGGSGGGG